MQIAWEEIPCNYNLVQIGKVQERHHWISSSSSMGDCRSLVFLINYAGHSLKLLFHFKTVNDGYHTHLLLSSFIIPSCRILFPGLPIRRNRGRNHRDHHSCTMYASNRRKWVCESASCAWRGGGDTVTNICMSLPQYSYIDDLSTADGLAHWLAGSLAWYSRIFRRCW